METGDELCVRFVVDIITGASAGGINGIFAKALANNQNPKPRDLIEQADLDLLLNTFRTIFCRFALALFALLIFFQNEG
jgi:hypothetical protein